MGRWADIHTDRQTYRYTDEYTDQWKNRETNKLKNIRKMDIKTKSRRTYLQIQRHEYGKTNRQTDKNTQLKKTNMGIDR
jgi:hypothetical protein